MPNCYTRYMENFESGPPPSEKYLRHKAVIVNLNETLTCGNCSQRIFQYPPEPSCPSETCSQQWEYIVLSEGNSNPVLHFRLPSVDANIFQADTYTPRQSFFATQDSERIKVVGPNEFF